jgi:hypothetical protein
MQPEIIITQKLGQPLKVEVKNVSGESCTDLTKPLDKLGEIKTDLKPEFYQQSTVDLNEEITIF